MSIVQRAADQRGMTLIEVMVASFILMTGILGVLTLIDRASAAQSTNVARVAATNHARDLIEHARSLDYDDVSITRGTLLTALRQRSGATTDTNPWKVTIRGVEYTVAAQLCLFDDPVDGLAANAPIEPGRDPACPRPAATNQLVDNVPDDFRRLHLSFTWNDRGRTRHLTQTALMVNPTGGQGPRITSLPQPTSQFTGTSVGLNVTTTRARTLRWTTDSGSGQGDIVGSPSATNWTIGWNLGTLDVEPFVRDGSYTVSAQAFTELGVPGETRSAVVHVNRRPPTTPTGFRGGRNTSGTTPTVDLYWNANPDRDIVEYRVVRLDGPTVRPICTRPAHDTATATKCSDENPPAGSARYALRAVDRTDLASASSTLRESHVPAELTVGEPGAAPEAPTGLRITTIGGQPRLEWQQPGGTEEIRFFRIYRGGTTPAHRHVDTVSNEPFWVDANPGDGVSASHTYYVSAVGVNFNESPLSTGVSWSG